MQLERLGQVRLILGFQQPFAIVAAHVRRDGDGRNVAQFPLFVQPQLANEREAVFTRHREIDEHEVR